MTMEWTEEELRRIKEARERMWKAHLERMQWWSDQDAVPRGNGAGATFRIDREDYTTMARTVRDQGCPAL